MIEALLGGTFLKITRRDFLATSLTVSAGSFLAGCGGGGGSSGPNTIEIVASINGTVQENLDRSGAIYQTQAQYSDLLVDEISYQGRRLFGFLHFYVNGQFPVGSEASIDDTVVRPGDRIRWVNAP